MKAEPDRKWIKTDQPAVENGNESERNVLFPASKSLIDAMIGRNKT